MDPLDTVAFSIQFLRIVSGHHFRFGRDGLWQSTKKDVLIWGRDLTRKWNVWRKQGFSNVSIIHDKPGNHPKFDRLTLRVDSACAPQWSFEVFEGGRARFFNQYVLGKDLVEVNLESR
jgi:hypothetical protein